MHPERPGDDVVDLDLLLLWTAAEPRIVTGSDLLGRLLRGIAQNPALPVMASAPANARRN